MNKAGMDEGKRVVAAIGVRYGDQLHGIRALLEGGFCVAAFDLGDASEEPLNDALQNVVDDLTAGWADVFTITGQLDGRIGNILAVGPEGAAAVLAEADRHFGETRNVYLGQWWGVVDYEVGADFIRHLAARCGGELVATESNDVCADKLVRWIARWSTQPWANGVSCGVVREEPGTGAHATHPSQHVLGVLVSSGWTGPLLTADADRVAAARKADGSDLIAGRIWEYVATGDVDSGHILVGDAEATTAALAASAELHSDGELSDTHAKEGFILFPTPGGDRPYGLEVTPPGGPIEAVRLSMTPEAYDYSDPYKALTAIAVDSGRLVISDPAYLRSGSIQPLTLEVVRGSWAVEYLNHDGELQGVRLRRQIPPATPNG